MKKYFLLLFAVLLLGSCTKNLHIAKTKQAVYTPQKHDFSVLTLQPKTVISPVFLQSLPTTKMVLSSQNVYEQAYYQIRQMLQGGKPLSFKKAVYFTENAYFDNELPENSFNQAIADLVSLTKAVGKTSKFSYKYADSTNLRKNFAIYRVLADTLNIANIFQLLPYEYDFEDARGEKEWAKGFVTKLLATRTGNCHSLPFLYKILAEELETEAYLSLLPHHIYLQIPFKRPPYSTQTYFNTELTSKTFPLDAWVETAGYVSNAAVVSGMYMDRLDTKQSIALCLVDLAKGFEARNKDKLSAAEIDQFMQNCVNLALQTAPNLITARLLQVEIEARKAKNFPTQKEKYFPSFKNLESLVTQLFADGYLELPELMYSEQPKTIGLDSTYTPFAEENIREGTPTGKGTVLTLSNGRYAEFKNAKKIETIGSVRFDTEKHKIVGFGENKRSVEVVSRFLSVDPLAQSYPFYSPYQFAANSPIEAIDLDGLEAWKVTKQWSYSDIGKFATFAKSRYDYYVNLYKGKNSGKDCGNFQTRVLVEYAAQEGLPLPILAVQRTDDVKNQSSITSEAATKIISSTDKDLFKANDAIKGVDEFMGFLYGTDATNQEKRNKAGVLQLNAYTLALFNSTHSVPEQEGVSGDLVFMGAKEAGVSHVSGLYGFDGEGKLLTSYSTGGGNNTLKKEIPLWHGSYATIEINNGLEYVSRWKVLSGHQKPNPNFLNQMIESNAESSANQNLDN